MAWFFGSMMAIYGYYIFPHVRFTYNWFETRDYFKIKDMQRRVRRESA